MPLRLLVAVMAAALVVLLGADLPAAGTERSAPHLPHSVAAGASHEVVDSFDHPHFQDDSSMPDPNGLATAIMPRASAVLVAMTLFGVAVTALSAIVLAIASSVRGPPRGPSRLVAGRLLTILLGALRR